MESSVELSENIGRHDETIEGRTKTPNETTDKKEGNVILRILGKKKDEFVKKVGSIQNFFQNKDEKIKGSECYPKVLRSLPNIGSTCFMNSVLQCFIWTPTLPKQLKIQMDQYKIAQRQSPNETKAGNPEFSSGPLITTRLHDLIVKACEKPSFAESLGFGDISENLKQLLDVLRMRNSQFTGFRQQDSFECFNTIISGIEEERRALLGQDESKEHTDDGPVSRLFEGMFLSVYKYSACDHTDIVLQKFTSISIPISEEESNNVSECEQSERVVEIQQKSSSAEATTCLETAKCSLKETTCTGESASCSMAIATCSIEPTTCLETAALYSAEQTMYSGTSPYSKPVKTTCTMAAGPGQIPATCLITGTTSSSQVVKLPTICSQIATVTSASNPFPMPASSTEMARKLPNTLPETAMTTSNESLNLPISYSETAIAPSSEPVKVPIPCSETTILLSNLPISCSETAITSSSEPENLPTSCPGMVITPSGEPVNLANACSETAFTTSIEPVELLTTASMIAKTSSSEPVELPTTCSGIAITSSSELIQFSTTCKMTATSSSTEPIKVSTACPESVTSSSSLLGILPNTCLAATSFSLCEMVKIPSRSSETAPTLNLPVEVSSMCSETATTFSSEPGRFLSTSSEATTTSSSEPFNLQTTCSETATTSSSEPVKLSTTCSGTANTSKEMQCLKQELTTKSRIDKGLKELTEIEIFRDRDLQCPECRKGSGGYCYKRLLIVSAPPVLVLQINRFKPSEVSGQLTKIQTMIDYPEILDISPFVSDSIKAIHPDVEAVRYALYGVICHWGTLYGGHYYAYVKTPAKMVSPLQNFLHDKKELQPEILTKEIKEFWKTNKKECDLSGIGKEIRQTIGSDTDENKGELSIGQEDATSPSCNKSCNKTITTNYVWYRISDADIIRVGSVRIDGDAYILMYERIQ